MLWILFCILGIAVGVAAAGCLAIEVKCFNRYFRLTGEQVRKQKTERWLKEVLAATFIAIMVAFIFSPIIADWNNKEFHSVVYEIDSDTLVSYAKKAEGRESHLMTTTEYYTYWTLDKKTKYYATCGRDEITTNDLNEVKAFYRKHLEDDENTVIRKW